MTTNPALEDAAFDAPPGPIPPTQTVRFPSRDGTALYGEYFAARAEPTAVALVMHGYAEHCGRYRELAHVLVNCGLSVLTYDMRGHGRAEGQRGHIDRIEDYFDDQAAALDKLDELVGTPLPRVLVGHSNGGLVCLRTLADPVLALERVAAAVVSSPYLGLAMKVHPVKSTVAKLAGRFLPTLSMPSEIPIDALTHDPRKLEERRIDTLCHDVASARYFSESLEAQEWLREFIGRWLEVPTLWLVAGGDEIVDPAATRSLHARVQAPSVFHEFPQMHHEVFNEVDRSDAFSMVRAFLNEHISQ